MGVHIDVVDLPSPFPGMEVPALEEFDRPVGLPDFDQEDDLPGQGIIPLGHDRMIRGQNGQPLRGFDVRQVIELVELKEKTGV
jgi:hypothetical protein